MGGHFSATPSILALLEVRAGGFWFKGGWATIRLSQNNAYRNHWLKTEWLGRTFWSHKITSWFLKIDDIYEGQRVQGPDWFAPALCNIKGFAKKMYSLIKKAEWQLTHRIHLLSWFHSAELSTQGQATVEGQWPWRVLPNDCQVGSCLQELWVYQDHFDQDRTLRSAYNRSAGSALGIRCI